MIMRQVAITPFYDAQAKYSELIKGLSEAETVRVLKGGPAGKGLGGHFKGFRIRMAKAEMEHWRSR